MSCNQKNRRFEELQQRCNFSGAFFAMALDSLAFTGFFQLEPVALDQTVSIQNQTTKHPSRHVGKPVLAPTNLARKILVEICSVL